MPADALMAASSLLLGTWSLGSIRFCTDISIYLASSVSTFSEESQLKRRRIGLGLRGGPCKQLIYRGRLEHGHAQDL